MPQAAGASLGPMARILIAGCGDVGSALALLLAADGHQVWGLRRTVARLPPAIEPLCADVTDPASLRCLPRDLDAVVYTAAAPARTADAYRATYPTGLGNVIDALAAAGQRPARLLFASSTSVYGQDDGGWVDETSPTLPSAFPGRLMLAAEAKLRQAPWPSVAIRFGGIYGPGRGRLIRRARAGEPVERAVMRWTNRIHRDDCAGVLRHLLALPAPAAVLNAVDDEPSTLTAVIDFICAQRGWPLPPACEPVAMASPAARGKRCRNRLLGQSGYRFRYPSFRQGYRAVLDTHA